MFRSDIAPWSICRVPVGHKRRHECVADRFRNAFDGIERVDSLVDSFPFRVFEGEIPNTPELERRLYEIAAVTSYSHMNERVVEELSIFIRDVAMLLFLKELCLASSDVRNNGIEVVIRVPE